MRETLRVRGRRTKSSKIYFKDVAAVAGWNWQSHPRETHTF